MTSASLKRLLGANCNSVCVYNIETEKLLSPKYNGCDVFVYNTQSESQLLKTIFETRFSDFDLVAQVSMQVTEMDSRGSIAWLPDAKFDKDGRGVAFNTIVRNKRTGALERGCKNGRWFYLGACRSPECVAARIARFVLDGSGDIVPFDLGVKSR